MPGNDDSDSDASPDATTQGQIERGVMQRLFGGDKPPSRTASVGSVLADRYRLVAEIGRGSMARVFRAVDMESEAECAVKVLRPSLCELGESVRRFRREVRVVGSIGSPHIVTLTDFGETESGVVFYVMECLHGEDLAVTLARETRLPWPRVVKIAIQLCNGLQAAHDVGVTHRDVKPSNCYRTEVEGRDFVKLVDFGVAALAAANDSLVTRTGLMLGTPEFMSPEQAQCKSVDHRADIYSLGATAYALLAGRAPFVGRNGFEIIHQVLNELTPAPSLFVKDVPGALETVVLRAMRKNPAERFSSMTEFAAALQQC